MKKFSKTFNYNKIKKNYSYSVSDLSEKLEVTKGAIYIWIKEGLKPNDKIKPYLFYGEEIRMFLKERQHKRKTKCNPNEMFCFKCQLPSRPTENKTSIKTIKGSNYIIQGFCSKCNTRMNKSFNAKNLEKIKKDFHL